MSSEVKPQTRGRPKKVELEVLVKQVLPLFDRVILSKGKIAPPSSGVWGEVAKFMGIGKKAAYSYFNKPRNQAALWHDKHPQDSVEDYCRWVDALRGVEAEIDKSQKNSSDEGIVLNEEGAKELAQINSSVAINFEYRYKKEEFKKKTEIRSTTKRGKKIKVTKFRRGWTDEMSKLIWNVTKCTCAFSFDNNRFMEDLSSGSVDGEQKNFNKFANLAYILLKIG